METIYYIGIVQAWFAALLLWKKKEISNADKVLSYWLIITGFELLISLLNLCVCEWLPDLIIVPFSYGPLLYFYTLLLSGNATKLPKHYLWHFSPIIIFAILSLFWNEPIEIHDSLLVQTNSITLIASLNYLLFIFSMFYYWYLSIKLINKHLAQLKQNFSYQSDNLKLTWLRVVSWWILGGFIASMLLYSVFTALGIYPFNPIYVYHFGLLFFIFSVTYKGIQQPEIYKHVKYSESSSTTSFETIKDNNNEEDHNFGLIIDQYMLKNKPYLNGELTIQELADRLGVSSAKISNYLNHYLNKNFFNYINEYRIVEAKNRIADTSYNNLTLVSIGLDSGFNSKSSFNSLFKKYTNLTPSEYKKQLQSGD